MAGENMRGVWLRMCDAAECERKKGRATLIRPYDRSCVVRSAWRTLTSKIYYSNERKSRVIVCEWN